MTEQNLGLIFGLGVIVGVAISTLVSFLTDLFS